LRNRTKKEQKDIDGLMGFIILVAGLVGWYMIGSLKGVLIAVGIGFGVIIFSVYGVHLVSRKECSNPGFRILTK